MVNFTVFLHSCYIVNSLKRLIEEKNIYNPRGNCCCRWNFKGKGMPNFYNLILTLFWFSVKFNRKFRLTLISFKSFGHWALRVKITRISQKHCRMAVWFGLDAAFVAMLYMVVQILVCNWLPYVNALDTNEHRKIIAKEKRSISITDFFVAI